MTDLSRVHLVGIGGAGMSGLARILLSRGYVVSGSDIKESAPVEMLRQSGAHIAVGHNADNLALAGELPTVVVTSFAAIAQDNPELVAAKNQGIEIIRRSDLLAELMSDYRQVLLAGTHGKTSTTSMTVAALQGAGVDPSFAIGGQLNKAGVNAHHGTGDVFVAEADESDGSLLRYEPTVAVVTNIEPDHLDYFGSEDAYYEVFEAFSERLVDGGHLVVCLDDTRSAELGRKASAQGISVYGYGTSEAVARYCDIRTGVELTALEARGAGTHICATVLGSEKVDYQLAVPGMHMALNSAAALLAGVLAGSSAESLAAGLAGYTGVRRRFDYHGTVESGRAEGARVYDDYAHHPTEVRAVLNAAREQVEGTGGKVVALFQPHLYSRTMNFAAEFGQALSLADAVVLLDIFGAREEPVEGVSSRIIIEHMSIDNVHYEPDFSAAARTVANLVGPKDIVLTVGAGTVTMLAPEILAELS